MKEWENRMQSTGKRGEIQMRLCVWTADARRMTFKTLLRVLHHMNLLCSGVSGCSGANAAHVIQRTPSTNVIRAMAACGRSWRLKLSQFKSCDIFCKDIFSNMWNSALKLKHHMTEANIHLKNPHEPKGAQLKPVLRGSQPRSFTAYVTYEKN